MNYGAPTPETDAFMLLIDDSEIDLGTVKAKLSDLECERNLARELVRGLCAELEEYRGLAEKLGAPLAVSERDAALAACAQMRDALQEIVDFGCVSHHVGCPEDDTCRCRIPLMINRSLSVAPGGASQRETRNEP